MQDAIKRLTGLKSEYGNFAPALEKEAQSIIQSIDEEEKLAIQIKSLMNTGAVRGTAGRLDSSKIDVAPLRACIKKATGIKICTCKYVVTILLSQVYVYNTLMYFKNIINYM